MLPDRVSNPGLLIYESGALPTALRGPAIDDRKTTAPAPTARAVGPYPCTGSLPSTIAPPDPPPKYATRVSKITRPGGAKFLFSKSVPRALTKAGLTYCFLHNIGLHIIDIWAN